MNGSDTSNPAPGMLAFLGSLDTMLAGAGYDVPAPPPPAPPPPPPAPRPALSFEEWAELSERFPAASPHGMAAALSARGVTLDAWTRLDALYRRALSDDLRAGAQHLAAIYQAKRNEVRGREAGSPVPPPASVNGTSPATPPAPLALPIPQRAPAALTGTAGLPDLPEIFATVGRMPFVPPPPEPPVKAKPAAKTVQSLAVQPRADRQTMALDTAQQRPTPPLPFARTDGSTEQVYVPPVNARQWVGLCAELMLQVASRLETLRRYRIPTEAEFRAVQEHWQHPNRRAELEGAMRELWAVMWQAVLR